MSTAITRCLVLLAAATIAGAGCGGGGQLSGAGGAGQIMTGGGGSGVGLIGGGTGTAGVTGMNCATIANQLQPLPSDILIVLDTSSSMNDPVACPTCDATAKWTSTVSAINSVVGATRPVVNWGLKLITNGSEACDAGGITVPTGTSNAGQIQAVLAQRTSSGRLATPGNTPLRAAIEVASAHLSGREPGPLRNILLLTDSVPDCKPGEADPLASDAAGAAQAVSAAAVAGIATYVVGVGVSDATADAALGQLAQAGGLARAGTPAYAPASGYTELMTAMNGLITETAACTFAVPDPPTNDGTTSRAHIELWVMGGDGYEMMIPRDPMNGWTYTDASMLGVQLHGSACDSGRVSASLYIRFPCYVG